MVSDVVKSGLGKIQLVTECACPRAEIPDQGGVLGGQPCSRRLAEMLHAARVVDEIAEFDEKYGGIFNCRHDMILITDSISILTVVDRISNGCNDIRYSTAEGIRNGL